MESRAVTPRGLSAPEAARYAGVSERTWRAGVKSGRYPKPLALGIRRAVWDRRAIDAKLFGDAPAHGAPGDEIMSAIDAASLR